MLAIIFCVLLLIMVICSVERMHVGCNPNNSVDRKQQLAMRGLAAVFIVYSHMYRNSGVYDSSLGNSIISLFSPSLLCIFFFYSGYGMMLKFMKSGKRKISEILITWINKLIVPAIVALLIANLVAYFLAPERFMINGYASFFEIGGWFLRTLLILQLIFYLNSYCFEKNLKIFIPSITIMVVLAMLGMRLAGLPSYYYIDCPAFLLGIFSCYFDKIWKQMLQSKVVFACSILLTICVCGGKNFILQAGYISEGLGIGLILGLVNNVSQVMMYQCFLSYFRFKNNNVFLILGNASYEIYLCGSIAIVFALFLAQDALAYYLLEIAGCIGIGILLHKIDIKYSLISKIK